MGCHLYPLCLPLQKVQNLLFHIWNRDVITGVTKKQSCTFYGPWPSHYGTRAWFSERVAACGDSNQQGVFSCVLQTILLELCSCLGHLEAETWKYTQMVQLCNSHKRIKKTHTHKSSAGLLFSRLCKTKNWYV